jgi:hypothetical protein
MSASAINEQIPSTVTKPFPWAKVSAAVQACSLEDVMSEQLANELNEKEFGRIPSKITPQKKEVEEESIPPELLVDPSTLDNEQVNNDFLIAQLMQLEMDKEYDEFIKGHENVRNRNSKISISLDKFKSVHPIHDKEEKEINAQLKGELSSESETEDGKFILLF